MSTQTSTPTTKSPVIRTQAATSGQDIGLLVLRLTVGLLLAAHGSQKLFGWFGGDGLDGTAAFLGKVGYSPAKAFAVISGLSEFGGGLMFAAGLATPLAAAAVIGTMSNAIAVLGSTGLWSPQGYEYPLVLALVGGAVGFTGSGLLSVDSLFAAKIPWLRGGVRPAAVSIVLGLVGAAVALIIKS
jgi:putative oxidoreductase